MRENPNIHAVPKLSEETVIPILDSLVNNNSLECIMLPKVWRERSTHALVAFIGNFSRLYTRGHRCSNCQRQHVNLMADPGEYYGLQANICHICMKSLCYSCGMEFCENCEREYCRACDSGNQCGACRKQFCSGCGKIKQCDKCETLFCSDCAPVGKNCSCWEGENLCVSCAPKYWRCEKEGCSASHCDGCCGEEEEDRMVDGCEDCFTTFCTDCRYSECSKNDWNDSCPGCLYLMSGIIPKLAQESEKLPKVQEENEKLRKENEELRKLTN